MKTTEPQSDPETLVARRPEPSASTSAPSSRRRILRRPGFALALVWVAILFVSVLTPWLITAADPIVGIPADKLLPPSPAHLFGTDQLGRDLLTRVVYGASISLGSAAIAVAIAFVVGGGVGLVAGFLGGRVDAVLMRLIDVLLAIPSLLLSMMLITALGYGVLNVAVAVGLASVASFARVMRAQVLTVRSSVYVEASRSFGAHWSHTVWRHVLPNSLRPVIALSTLEFGVAVLSVSALSFLGYGAPPPAPEWGALISDGRNYLSTAWWLTLLPGVTLVATVLAANRISQTLGSHGRTTR